MKFSNKDILLVFGILIAVVVTLTTLVYKDQHSAAKKTELPAAGKTSFNQATHKLLRHMAGMVEVKRINR